MFFYERERTYGIKVNWVQFVLLCFIPVCFVLLLCCVLDRS